MNRTIKYGLLTSLFLIIYFILMKLIGQEANFSLRFLNFFILIGGVYALLANSYAKSPMPSYFEGLISGLLLTVTAVVAFVIFLAAYVSFIDPGFIEILENSRIWGNRLSIGEAAFAIFIEGIASGVVISFAWMQYFKSRLSAAKA